MSTCEMIDTFFGIEARCGQPGTLVRRICVHEHVRVGYMCAFHVEHAPIAGQCRTCWEGPLKHECPITVVPAGEEAVT